MLVLDTVGGFGGSGLLGLRASKALGFEVCGLLCAGLSQGL